MFNEIDEIFGILIFLIYMNFGGFKIFGIIILFNDMNFGEFEIFGILIFLINKNFGDWIGYSSYLVFLHS